MLRWAALGKVPSRALSLASSAQRAPESFGGPGSAPVVTSVSRTEHWPPEAAETRDWGGPVRTAQATECVWGFQGKGRRHRAQEGEQPARRRGHAGRQGWGGGTTAPQRNWRVPGAEEPRKGAREPRRDLRGGSVAGCGLAEQAHLVPCGRMAAGSSGWWRLGSCGATERWGWG